MSLCNATTTDSFSGHSELERLQLTNDTLQDDNTRLRAEVDDLNKQLQQYKLVSQSFETRVLDLQKELRKYEEASEQRAKSFSRVHAAGDGDHSSSRESTDENGMEPEQFRKLFIGGLSYQTTDESLKEYFSQFGQIIDCVVMKDASTKRSRGFGFVVYSKISMVDLAQDARPHIVDKREVETKRAVPKGDHLSDNQLVTKKIFVGGLRDATDEEGLTEYFGRFGKVDHVDMIEDRSTKRMRGFAYVTFSDYDPVDKAVLQKFHTIDGRRCEVKKALSRVMMKNRKNAGGPNSVNGSIPQQQNAWNNSFPWGNNFDGGMGGMCTSSTGNMGGGCGMGFGDLQMANLQHGVRNMCSGWNQCMANNWNAGGGSHFCGDANHRGWQDTSGTGWNAAGSMNKCNGRNHDSAARHTARGGRSRRTYTNMCGGADRLASPNDFTSD